MQQTLVCLHGWGGSGASFTELRSALEGSGIAVLSPDLPGFGKEPEPLKPWNTDAYADWVVAYIRTQVQGPYALLGHSHGGRIAIELAARLAQDREALPPPTHLFLCAAVGIRHPSHIKRIIGLLLAKAGKPLLSIPGLASLQATGKRILYKILRVHDYEHASLTMRQTLVLVSQENLRPLLERISIPTSIFWGEEDTMTPLSDGMLMHEQIRGSTLVTFPGVRHRVHRDEAQAIGKAVRSTLHS